jgi:2-keto-3-deoxy-L-rhamnonate aldolase RhmA
MTALANPARDRLAAGALSLGIGLRQARTVDIAKAMKTCGYDWLFIDLEHNAMSLDVAVQISVAAQDAGIAPLVRVPRGQYWMATRALDGGALGIVMPHVEDAEEARAVVDHLKYPPLGHRSVASALPQLDFAGQRTGEAIAALNAATLVVAMVETPDAVANADSIAAVAGIDVVMVGTGDLSTELGVPGQTDDKRVAAAIETVVAACRAHGKWPGMGGAYGGETLARYIGAGMRFILAASDLGMLMAAASRRTEELRKILPG